MKRILLFSMLLAVTTFSNLSSNQLDKLKEMVGDNQDIYLFFIPKDIYNTCNANKIPVYQDVVLKEKTNSKVIAVLSGFDKKEDNDIFQDYLKDILSIDEFIVDYDNKITNFYTIYSFPTLLLINNSLEAKKIDKGLRFELKPIEKQPRKISYIKEDYPMISIDRIFKKNNSSYIIDKNTNVVYSFDSDNLTPKLKMNKSIYNYFLDQQDMALMDSLDARMLSYYTNYKMQIQPFDDFVIISDSIYLETPVATGLKYIFNEDNRKSYELKFESVLINLESKNILTLDLDRNNSFTYNNQISNFLFYTTENDKGMYDSLFILTFDGKVSKNVRKIEIDPLIQQLYFGKFELINNQNYYLSLSEKKFYLLNKDYQVDKDLSSFMEKIVSENQKEDERMYIQEYMIEANRLYFLCKHYDKKDKEKYLIVEADLDKKGGIKTVKEIPNTFNKFDSIKILNKNEDYSFEFIVKFDKSRWARMLIE